MVEHCTETQKLEFKSALKISDVFSVLLKKHSKAVITSTLSDFIAVWIIFSASPLADWIIKLENKTSNSLQLQWMDINHRLIGGARFFVVIAKSSYSSVPVRKIFSPSITSAEITGLDPYTVYNVNVVAIDGNGSPFNSSVLQARTDESGEYKLLTFWLLL